MPREPVAAMRKFDGFIKGSQEAEIEDRIAGHCGKHGIDPLDAVKLFPVLSRRQLLKRFLAHVELFRMSLEVPGDVAELGVFRGFDLMTWANLLEAYAIGNRTKIVYGFDNWHGFTDLAPEDGGEDKRMQRKARRIRTLESARTPAAPKPAEGAAPAADSSDASPQQTTPETEA